MCDTPPFTWQYGFKIEDTVDFPYNLTGATVTIEIKNTNDEVLTLVSPTDLTVAVNTPTTGKSRISFRDLTNLEFDLLKVPNTLVCSILFFPETKARHQFTSSVIIVGG
jgi:archaellum component FlaG (FlaF/FlaG flagellin family)